MSELSSPPPASEPPASETPVSEPVTSVIAPAASRRNWRDLAQRPWTIAVAVLVVLLVWQWYDNHSRMSGLREELAGRLRDSDADSRDARLVARQAQEAVREAQARLAQLDAKLAESQNQQVALEALYQELSRNRDEWALAEIDQILTIASQQLQLAGNVQAALVGMQTAEARLARADRPQFIPLRKVLTRDIERLKATPNLDVAGLALRMDQIIAGIDTLPLAGEERISASAQKLAGASESTEGLLSRIAAEIWSELKSLVRIQVMDGTEPGLVAPSQAFFLRENLKLRMLNARLALLSRDEATFREDIKTASAWLSRWFDARSKATQAAAASMKQLNAAAIQIELPTIADSLNAVRNYKLARDRAR